MISYKNIYNYNVPAGPSDYIPGANAEGPVGDIHRFRRVDRSGFNATDDLDKRYFKILFYFYNDDSDTSRWDHFNSGSSGLLTPTWLEAVNGDYYKYNSAWAYLKNNYEEERADALIEFITLLSQISSESPWYFQTISGVDEALGREKWNIGDERKKITIGCLSDPVDHRIESLLSLYRSIVWSHARKCEVLPANLRKFDMGLFIFSGVINGLHVMRDDYGNQVNWAPIGHVGLSDRERSTYKYIEFHNCEISMDSIKSGYGEMSNSEGFEQTFNIDIYFDDCYEHEFNQFVLSSFGDLFLWDVWVKNGINESGNTDGNVPNFDEIIEQQMNDYMESDSWNPDTRSRLNYFLNSQYQMNQVLGMGITSSKRHDGNNSKIDSITQKQSTIEEEHKQEMNEVDKQQIKKDNVFKAEQEKEEVKTEQESKEKKVDSIINKKEDKEETEQKNQSSIFEDIKEMGISTVTGGLGNIHGTGGGILGASDALNQEINIQYQTITNKLMGNISSNLTDLSKSATATLLSPILGSIKTSGNVITGTIDSIQENEVKPFFGSIKNNPILNEESKTYLGHIFNNDFEVYKIIDGDNIYKNPDGTPIKSNKIGQNRIKKSRN